MAGEPKIINQAINGGSVKNTFKAKISDAHLTTLLSFFPKGYKVKKPIKTQGTKVIKPSVYVKLNFSASKKVGESYENMSTFINCGNPNLDVKKVTTITAGKLNTVNGNKAEQVNCYAIKKVGV